jgi:hypothetical protein
VADRFDELDAWLDAPVEPLPAPPGTFQRIQRRARRRKTAKLMSTAAGVVVVIALAFAVPFVVPGLHGPSGNGKPTALGTPTSASRVRSGNGNGSVNSRSNTRPAPAASLSPGGSASPVPANFQPTSVTFVGPNVGAVIGQAGTPGQCATRYCTSLAGTSDYGANWYGVNAPVTGAPDGSSGVSQIRFLNTRDGWAFGPGLWVTHNGGASWTPEQTSGLRVTDLETAGDMAFALFASCTGTGSDYGSGCTSFSLQESADSGDQWTPVPGASASLSAPAGQPGSASLVLTASSGYLLAPTGELLSGPLTGAAWTVAGAALPCQPGAPGSAGQPTSALLAADPVQLILLCTSPAPGTDTQLKSVYQSTDGGAQWSATGTPPATGIATSLAAQTGGGLLLATDAGIFRSVNNGSTWQLAQASPAGAAAGQAGFSYVGMTSFQNGVALPADPSLHQVFTTGDGGSTWQARLVSAP